MVKLQSLPQFPVDDDADIIIIIIIINIIVVVVIVVEKKKKNSDVVNIEIKSMSYGNDKHSVS